MHSFCYAIFIAADAILRKSRDALLPPNVEVVRRRILRVAASSITSRRELKNNRRAHVPSAYCVGIKSKEKEKGKPHDLPPICLA